MNHGKFRKPRHKIGQKLSSELIRSYKNRLVFGLAVDVITAICVFGAIFLLPQVPSVIFLLTVIGTYRIFTFVHGIRAYMFNPIFGCRFNNALMRMLFLRKFSIGKLSCGSCSDEMAFDRIDNMAMLGAELVNKDKKISDMAEKIKKIKEISSIHNRTMLKGLFSIIIILFMWQCASIGFLYYYERSTSVIFDMVEYLAILRYSIYLVSILTVGVMITLYKIIWGSTSVKLCANCRRIQWKDEWHQLETFVGKPSHDLCEICADAIVRNMEEKLDKKLISIDTAKYGRRASDKPPEHHTH